MKIFKTNSSDELTGYDIERIERIDAEYFVYNYKVGDWEGTGWAVWKMPDGKFGYTSLSHCSCNGPVEDINSIPYTLDEVKKISDEHYSEYSEDVIKMVEMLES